jgi:signal transduction histidine kinase
MDMYNLTLSDFPKHSAQRKLIYLTEHLQSETFLGEMSRKQVENAQKLLEMKRMFVRYVSHEIRTPLNTVSLGLHLVNSMMQKREEEQRHEDEASGIQNEVVVLPERQVVEEIMESCDEALTILNDLLMYEKMEDGGGFVLDKKEEPILALVQSVSQHITTATVVITLALFLSCSSRFFGCIFILCLLFFCSCISVDRIMISSSTKVL